MRNVGELSGSAVVCVSVLSDVQAILLSSYFLHASVFLNGIVFVLVFMVSVLI